MPSYKHILLATDLSSTSDTVVKRAQEIAKNYNAKLSAIHVLEYTPIAYAGEFTIPIDINVEQLLETNARKALEKLGKKYNINPKNLYLEKGSVKSIVTKLAETLKTDLIVVGTHGHHGIDILLGSHANAILHVAPCDVLVVRIK